MRKFVALIAAFVALTLIMEDADARRMGGGRSIGKQREAISPNQAAPRAPAQQQQQANKAAPAQQQQAAPAAGGAAQQAGGSRWLGPLAGLAIGAGLAALFFHNGLAGALLGILLLAALVAGAFMLVRLLRGGRSTQQAPLRYAGANPYGGSAPAPRPVAVPAATAPSLSGTPAPHSLAATLESGAAGAQTQWPADFDAEQFLRHARLNFVNLQQAHDRRDLTSIRDFLTPELYREIEAEVRAAGDSAQKTDIVTLNADVLDVVTEGALYVVSVRFSGLIREEAGQEAEPFAEIWHLEKPTSGRSGWLVSGIQQV